MEDSVNILNELQDLGSAVLINAERKNLYTYPNGYFNDLSTNIVRQVWIQSLPSSNPYSVPPGYFQNLPELILDKSATKFEPSDFRINDLYDVPDNYFNNLAGNILQKITDKRISVQQELEEVSPLLSKIPKTNVYTVPKGYFKNLVVQPEFNIQPQPAKVISIGNKTRKWVAYAAAACVAALMFGGGYFYFQDKSALKTTPNTHTEIAEANIKQAILQLSDSEIDNYLKSDNSEIYTNQNSDSPDININTLLENMSDEEINNYLLKNAEPGEKMKGI